MPTPIEQAQRFREQLKNNVNPSVDILMRTYRGIVQRLNSDISALVSQIEAMQAKGEDVNAGKIVRLQQYKQLLADTQEEIEGYQSLVEAQTAYQVETSYEKAIYDARDLVRVQLPSGVYNQLGWSSLVPAQVEAIVGMLSPESLLYQRIQMMAGFQTDLIADTITQGVGLGWNPVKITREIQNKLGYSLENGLRTVRTAQIYAYREAARANYAANSDILDGWYWNSALMPGRTCMSCVRMHGTFHGLNETLNDHDNGLCSPLPGIKGLEPIGLTSGQDWFSKQPESVQQQMFANNKLYSAYRDGRLQWEQLTSESEHPVYGTIRSQSSYKNLFGE